MRITFCQCQPETIKQHQNQNQPTPTKTNQNQPKPKPTKTNQNQNQPKPTRFARDKEASIRRLALTLLSNLLAPGADATQRMLVLGWPDCGARAMRVACDAFECHAVRAAALAFVCAAAAVDPVALLAVGGGSAGDGQPAGEEAVADQQEVEGEGEGGAAGGLDGAAAPGALRQLHRLGLASLLQQQQLWEALPPLLGAAAAGAAPPALAAAACSLAAAALAADPQGVGMRLLVGRATWEGPQPLIARALAAVLPPGAGAGGGPAQQGSLVLADRQTCQAGGGGQQGEVDVASALLAIAWSGVEAQTSGGGLPEACSGQLRVLEWLSATG
jgi:hypothetical protein